MEFGELKNVNLREVWGHEANDFTPWLAASIERLSKAIGVPMELEGTEVDVGASLSRLRHEQVIRPSDEDDA